MSEHQKKPYFGYHISYHVGELALIYSPGIMHRRQHTQHLVAQSSSLASPLKAAIAATSFFRGMGFRPSAMMSLSST